MGLYQAPEPEQPAGEGCSPWAPERGVNRSSIGASRGTFLDPTITLRGGAGAALLAAVTGHLSTCRKSRRKCQVREQENEQFLLSCMLANALRCIWHRTTPLVAYQRKADAKFYTLLNRPKWLSGQAVGRTVSLLSEIGLVEHRVGERGTSSGYFATVGLLRLAEAAGVSERSLGRNLHRHDLVQLKGPKPKPVFDPFTRTLIRRRAERIHFEPTAETKKWCEGLTAFNDFVALHDVSVETPGDVLRRWVAGLNDDHLLTGAELCRPELFRDAVYRVFNEGVPENPTFDRGGRLVGGWWINAPEEVRTQIKIDGECTSELDYSACHPRMLYHERQLEGPSDLYEIPEVIELERRDACEAGTYRPLVKWLTQILINGRGRPDQVPVPSSVKTPPDITLREITTFIRQRHEPISSSFGSRAGLRLMKVESEIAFAVVSKAKEEGWLALPIHDSFIAQTSKTERLREIMTQQYRDRLGRDPQITIKSGKSSN